MDRGMQGALTFNAFEAFEAFGAFGAFNAFGSLGVMDPLLDYLDTTSFIQLMRSSKAIHTIFTPNRLDHVLDHVLSLEPPMSKFMQLAHLHFSNIKAPYTKANLDSLEHNVRAMDPKTLVDILSDDSFYFNLDKQDLAMSVLFDIEKHVQWTGGEVDLDALDCAMQTLIMMFNQKYNRWKCDENIDVSRLTMAYGMIAKMFSNIIHYLLCAKPNFTLDIQGLDIQGVLHDSADILNIAERWRFIDDIRNCSRLFNAYTYFVKSGKKVMFGAKGGIYIVKRGRKHYFKA